MARTAQDAQDEMKKHMSRIYLKVIVSTCDSIRTKRPSIKYSERRYRAFDSIFIQKHKKLLKRMDSGHAVPNEDLVHLDSHKMAAAVVLAVLESSPLQFGAEPAHLCNEYLAMLMAFEVIKGFQLYKAGKTHGEVMYVLPRMRWMFPVQKSANLEAPVFSSIINSLFLLTYETGSADNSAMLLAFVLYLIDKLTYDDVLIEADKILAGQPVSP